MKTRPALLTFCILSGLTGCACTHPPAADTLASIPVIEFGGSVPKDGDFILHFPADKPIPVITSIKGSALAQEAEATAKVNLKKEIYAYKDWVSFDREHWQKGDDVLSINADIKIPSVEHPEPGTVKLQVDFK